ncbi:Putative Holin-X, holin superfamily III [Sphingomonas gellani]|uniref:Putative Holin-X, holin superfamily III n=1 Tax=Sphingomonas gellani TaxID=1166340 RepID=A0A1H8EK74_9SPHN|nr:phage holin family protein [Sphingomonas gellani]SEN19971.1 Putative Holin-X, holin superfamily III [Sphingomonas gellani]
MLDTLSQDVGPAGDADEGVATLVHRLVADSRLLAQAEIALYKAKAAERIDAYKNAAIFFAVAGVLALSALIALLVGLIMTLATLIGPGFATAAVVVGTLVVAGILGMIGKGKLAPATPQVSS